MTGKQMNLIKLSDETDKCRERLEAGLSDYSRVAIAFSGGIDSTLLLEAAFRNKSIVTLAVLVKTTLNPQSEIESAIEFLKYRNIDYSIIEKDILSEMNISTNPPDRCYHCKKYIFTGIIKAAKEKDFTVLLDGTHTEDFDDYRPGLKALNELGIISPLKDSGFNKSNIRELARYYSLDNWNIEASPCLATRIPFGTEIREQDLRRIEKGESFLKEIGFTHVRLRLHETVARLEIPVEQIIRFNDKALRIRITEYIKSLGFDFITLDLEGYRTGSMNLKR